ncbi:hypothetical protein THRCLA_04823 [Thraustotheca clavata]|uniref:FYVE-type domain-containing protein n=1 Tax=Thraustotheca clavata TaxID=74557 RepID=A0A1V9ZXV8_9STRA|nr:hypothetical protein THRCLA_04823 [Thraustotheca clavata]
MPRKQYPLQTNAFKVPRLTSKEEAHFVHTGERALRSFLDNVFTHDDGILWETVDEQHGVRLLEGKSVKFEKGLTCLRAISKVNATIEEVAQLHAFETREKCFEYMRHYSSDILDMIPLYSFVKRTEDHPLRQMYVKWVAVESPVPMIKDRDYLYIEPQNEFVMSNGRRGWAYCQTSISLPCVPPLQDTELNLVRATLNLTGCVFFESETPGVLDVVYHMATDFKGSIPPWVIKMALRRRARKITMITDYVHGLRLSTQPLHTKEEVAKVAKPAKNCSICGKSFRFHRQKACQACSNAVCTSCSHSWRVNGGITGPTRARICTFCSDSVRDGPWEKSVIGTCRSAKSDSTGPWTTVITSTHISSSPTEITPPPIQLYMDEKVHRPQLSQRQLFQRQLSQRKEIMPTPSISPSNKATTQSNTKPVSISSKPPTERLPDARMDLSYLNCYGASAMKSMRAPADRRPLTQVRRDGGGDCRNIKEGGYDKIVDTDAEKDGRTMKYPLEDNFFRCPKLSASQQQHYLEQGDKILRTFLDKTLKRDESMRWSFVGEYDGVRLLEGDIPGLKLDKSTVPFRAVTKIHATLEEIADMHAFETRALCRRFVQNYAHDVLDMITLHNLLERTPNRPLKQVYIKWSVCESPVPMIKDRDFVYIESQDIFKLSSGRRGWALCQNSIELPYVGSLQKTPLQAIRGTLNHTGSVYIETDTPGVLDVIYHISSDMKGNIHHWVRKQAMKRRARHVAVLNDYIHENRLAQVELKAKSELYATQNHQQVQDNPVHNCSLCERGLRPQQVRFCQSCAEPVCSSCSRKWRLPNMATDQPSVRICNICSAAVRSGQVIADDGNHSVVSRTASDASSSGSHHSESKMRATSDARKLSMTHEQHKPRDINMARHRSVEAEDVNQAVLRSKKSEHLIRYDEDTMDLSYLNLYHDKNPVIRQEPSASSFAMMEDTDDNDEDEVVLTPKSRHGSMDFDDPNFERFVNHITTAPIRNSLRVSMQAHPRGR